MTPAELDYSRSRLLCGNKALAVIILGGPSDFVFEGRRRCDAAVQHCTSKRPCTYHKLEREQLRFNELRVRFLTTRSVKTMHTLARWLPRFHSILRRAATGYRDSRGAVRLYDQCPHGRPIQDWKDCERCADEAAECDAL